MPKIQTGTVIYRNYDCKFDKMLSNSKTKRRIGVNFLIKEGILHAIDEDNNEVAMPLNSSVEAVNQEKIKLIFEEKLSKTGDTDFYVQKVIINDHLPFMQISSINALRREILEKLMIERVLNYETAVQKTLKYTKFPCNTVDYRANIHNNLSKKFYEKCGCDVIEYSYESNHIKNAELMRTKHCIKYAIGMCKTSDKLYLVDDKGKKFCLIFDCKNCEMAVIG